MFWKKRSPEHVCGFEESEDVYVIRTTGSDYYSHKKDYSGSWCSKYGEVSPSQQDRLDYYWYMACHEGRIVRKEVFG